jgi:flagellar motor component MotA
MNNEEFVKEYKETVNRIFVLSEKARREGLLATEELIDENKYNQRDILEFGLRLVVDGTDAGIIDRILTNIINLEADSNKKLLQTIRKEAVLRIQEGLNPRLLKLILNSYVNIEVEETMKQYNNKNVGLHQHFA